MFFDAFPTAITVNQNSFKAIGANFEKIMALTEMNLKEITAIGISPFNFYREEMPSPSSDSSVSESCRALPFGFRKSLDRAKHDEETVVDVFGVLDNELMLDSPIETMNNRGQYDAAIWDDDVPCVVG